MLECYKMFVTWASGLGDYQALTKTELANGYLDAEEAKDEIKRNQYYAALMIRYWYKIYEFAKECKFMRLTVDDFVGWVSESLDRGLHYRKWRDPENKLYNDPNGPDKVFQRCFITTKQRYFQIANRDQNYVNYIADSIDRQEASFQDGADYLEDSGVVFDEVAERETVRNAREVVQHFIDRGDLIGAIILDCIAFQDTSIDCVEDNVKCSKFSLSKLTRTLLRLGDWYTEGFMDAYYDVDKNKLESVVNKLTNLSRTHLNKYFRKTIQKAQDSSVVRGILC